MTTDYKTVFQLAQDKGYKLYQESSIKNMEDVVAVNPKRQKFLDHVVFIELTLIQKWLRDEYKIWVLVEWQHAKLCWAVVKSNNSDYETENVEAQTSYESALLEGIHEALKLL